MLTSAMISVNEWPLKFCLQLNTAKTVCMTLKEEILDIKVSARRTGTNITLLNTWCCSLELSLKRSQKILDKKVQLKFLSFTGFF